MQNPAPILGAEADSAQPPEEIAGDPERLQLWRDLQARRQGQQHQALTSYDEGRKVYEISGCGKTGLFVCYHPTESEISSDDYTVGSFTTTLGYGEDDPDPTVLSAVRCDPARRAPDPSEYLSPADQPARRPSKSLFALGVLGQFDALPLGVEYGGILEIRPLEWLETDWIARTGGQFGPALSQKVDFVIPIEHFGFGFGVGLTEAFLDRSSDPYGSSYAGAPSISVWLEPLFMLEYTFGSHFSFQYSFSLPFLLNQGAFAHMTCPLGPPTGTVGELNSPCDTGFGPWELGDTALNGGVTIGISQALALMWRF